MKFEHPGYYTEIDTDDLETIKLFVQLDEIYKGIPKTKCLQCPLKSNVQADCCKVFSPPMYLVEFLNIFRKMEDFTKEQKMEIVSKCIDSVLDPQIIKPCLLLDGLLCSVYGGRPFSCRMFGVYSQVEWKGRLKSYSHQLGIPPEEIPFFEQCKGVEVIKKKKSGVPAVISKDKSDDMFDRIQRLDISLFKDRACGTSVVYSTATYIPFDAHYLQIIIGPENLENLVTMKISLRKNENLFEEGEISEKEYKKIKKEVKDFASIVKESMTLK